MLIPRMPLRPEPGSQHSKAALQEWFDKTSWFKPQAHELGLHKADAIYNRLQFYIGLAARRNIELQLVQQLLDNPDQEFTASVMEYWTPLHDQLYRQLTCNHYQQAVDHELVLAHLGVADSADDLSTARKKLQELLDYHVQVATDPLTNGGYKLVKFAT
jgi:hypothetical protein